MEKKPKIIVFNVTSLCNSSCDFCFGPERKSKEYSTKECIEKIKYFKKRGYEKIVFSGGEPLLRGDIVDLLEYAKNLGFMVILHTNGFLYDPDLYEEISKMINQINLPIDGSNEQNNDSMRGGGHFKTVQKSLNYFCKKKSVKIVISTVATEKNIQDVFNIGLNLPSCVYKWRIFQYRCSGRSLPNNGLKVNKVDFERVVNKIKDNKYKFIVQIVKDDDKEFYSSYTLR